jgi:prefoldin subunit 5
MSDEESPLLERVASYYSQLSTVAADLNAVSDELGKSVSEIDAALKKLNLGITTWVAIRNGEGNRYQDDLSYWSWDIGYAKVEGKWGICLRKVEGDNHAPDDDRTEEWLFSDAPRSLRLEAIDKIPELLEKLSKDAVKTTKDIRARLDEAQAVAEAVKGAANRAAPDPLRISSRVWGNMATQVKAPEAETVPAPLDPNSVSAVRHAVGSALVEAGHVAAAQLLGAGSWALDGASIRIEVAGMGKKMLALTVNAAAERIIRQELQRLGAPTRFLVVPGERIGQVSAPISVSDTLVGASTEVK